MVRFSGAVLIVTSVLGACSGGAKITSVSGPVTTYMTTPFAITPRDIVLVDDMVPDRGNLILYVDAGACTHPADQMEPVTVLHPPRGAFHVGQLIAVKVFSMWPRPKIGIRTVTREEAQRVGCSAAT